MNLFDDKKLPTSKAVICTIICTSTYNMAVLNTFLIGLIPIYFLSLLYITKVEKYRHVFYLGWLAGLITFSIHIRFFLNIFGNGSILLWLILSFWPAIFVLISKWILSKFKSLQTAVLISLTFFILEYVSCELYPLRFSWCSAGYLTHQNPTVYLMGLFGIYGFSLLVLLITLLCENSSKRSILIPFLISMLCILSFIKTDPEEIKSGPIVTGIQLEFPEQIEVLNGLEKAKKAFPETDIFMLSEYTFKEGIPKPILNWCKEHKTYLVAGTTTKANTPLNGFYNTAVVVGPEGKIIFKQAKAQPIQFFNDGLPAPKQELWKSPWGKVGICICYDLSYTRVVDELVNLGAEALFVPTMDVESWGKSEHRLHERAAPIRAAEYGIHIFKVASSGVSQSVNSKGRVIASASFPGQGEMISSRVEFSSKTSKPVDRYLFIPALLVLISSLLYSHRKKLLLNSFLG